MKPADITRLRTLGRPTLSPDGRNAVVAVTHADLDENDYRSSLWIIATDGSTPPRRLTHGEHDSEPRYSPDGAQIAFLRAEGEGKPQLHLLSTAGGDAHAITDLPLGAGSPEWSPDSSAIAFTARVPEAGRYGTDEKIPAEKEAPRRITGLTYRLDNVGFLVDRRRHVFIVELADSGSDTVGQITSGDAVGQITSGDAVRQIASGDAVHQITSGDYEDADVVWCTDRRLAFLSARHERREHDRCTDVFLIDRDGTDLVQVTDTSLTIDGVAATDDPDTLLVVAASAGTDGEGWLARNSGLWRVDIGSAPVRPVRLTEPEPVHLGASWIVPAGDRALVAVENRGALDLASVAVDGSGVRTVSSGQRQITAVDIIDLENAADVVVAIYTDTTTSGELARVGDDGTLTTLTGFGADLEGHLVPITEIETAAPDGYPVHGFLALPQGPGPHPVLLMIHGGPFTQYGWTNLDEAQVYAAAGYAVVYGNPRGSSGYGEAHGRFIVGHVGERQSPDLLALLDAALERPELDGERVGVLGGSHGGYMTTWLIGHSDRFLAAVSERSVNAIDSFEGSSDIGWDFADQLYGTDPDQRRRQSPLTHADAIETPVLIIHSEHDWRCPVEQAQRLYVALRKRDAPVEMLLFPAEGHELSRSGVPSHRAARFDAILEWFDRYLMKS